MDEVIATLSHIRDHGDVNFIQYNSKRNYLFSANQANVRPATPHCPCCRKSIPRSKCTPLFPDSDENNAMNEAQPELGQSEEIVKLKVDIKKTTEELQEYKDLYKLQWYVSYVHYQRN